MRRTQIYLDPAQRRLLREVADERGSTLSELIREAVWQFISVRLKPKGDPLSEIVALYTDANDSQGSVNHDDIYD